MARKITLYVDNETEELLGGQLQRSYSQIFKEAVKLENSIKGKELTEIRVKIDDLKKSLEELKAKIRKLIK